MDERMIFAVLGIEKTKDEAAIRTAYRTLLSQTNPEDDPEGFKRLREAYEKALALAKTPDAPEGGAEEPEDETPPGQWMKRVRDVYFSLSRRLSEDEWKRLLSEDICQDLEYGEEIRWRLFSFLAEHFHLTSRIYQMLDHAFHIQEDQEAFREHLPVEFVEYLLRRVQDQDGAMDFNYDRLEGADDADYDAFMRYYHDLATQTQDREGGAADQTIRMIRQLQIDHPLFRLEVARAALLNGRQEEALQEIVPLLETTQDSLRIQVLGAEILYQCGRKEEAVEIFRRYDGGGYSLVEKYLASYENEKGNLLSAIRHCLKVVQETDDPDMKKRLEEMDAAYIDRYAPRAEDRSLTDEEASCLIGSYSRRDRAQEALDFLERYPSYAEHMERLHEYRSRLYYQVGRYRDSIAECRLWREDPGETRREYAWMEGEAWTQLAKQGEKGAWDQALAAYQEARRLAPEDVEIAQCVLDTLIEMARFEDAIALADEIIAGNEAWFPAYAQRQKACFELHRPQEVVDYFYRAKQIYAGYPPIYERAMEVFCVFGQYADADNILRQAQEEGVESPMLDILRLRSDRLKEWNAKREKKETDTEALTRLADQLKAKYSKDPADNYLMGKLFAELGFLRRDRRDYRTAAHFFRKAISYDDVPFYHYVLANALFDLGNAQEALEEYQYYERLTEPDEDLFVNMARCYRFAHQEKAAIVYFKKVLGVNDQNEEANGAIAALYRNMLVGSGNLYYGRLGLPYAHRQLEITPKDGYYLRERGLMYLEMNLWKEALADFEASLAVEPENPYGWNLKGKVCYYLKQDQEAMECFQTAIRYMQADEPFSGPFLNAGSCMRRLGRFEEAEKWYKEGLERLGSPPTYSLCQGLLGLYKAFGRFAEARAVLREERKHSLIDQEAFELALLRIDVAEHLEKNGSYVARAEKEARAFDSADAWTLLAQMYLYEGDDCDRALEAALTALEKAEKAGQVWENYGILLLAGRCCLQKGDPKEAARYGRRLLDEMKKAYAYNREEDAETQFVNDIQSDVENQCDLAKAYLLLGDLDRARAYLALAGEKDLCRKCSRQSCSERFECEGMIREAEGETAQAAACYRKALEIDRLLCYSRYRLGKLEPGGSDAERKEAQTPKKKRKLAFWRKDSGK